MFYRKVDKNIINVFIGLSFLAGGSISKLTAAPVRIMRNKVMKGMAEEGGVLKLMFATEAYSMGTNALDIRRVNHAGVSGTLETYIQDIGSAGRDGEPSVAILHYNKTDLSGAAKEMADEMRDFCRTRICRRKFLWEHFQDETMLQVLT